MKTKFNLMNTKPMLMIWKCAWSAMRDNIKMSGYPIDGVNVRYDMMGIVHIHFHETHTWKRRAATEMN